MLLKISSALYSMRNEIAYDLITLPIEGIIIILILILMIIIIKIIIIIIMFIIKGTICPRSIIKQVESVMFFGSDSEDIYADHGTVNLRYI